MLIKTISPKNIPTPKLIIIVSPQLFLIMFAESLNDSFIEFCPITSDGKLKYVMMLHAAPKSPARILPIRLDLLEIAFSITPTVADTRDQTNILPILLVARPIASPKPTFFPLNLA